MRTLLVDEPGFAGQTAAFLDQLGPAAEISGYDALVAARAEPSDPRLSGLPDPGVSVADLFLPLRGGPVLARLYRTAGPASEPGPVLLWLHGGGFTGGSVYDLDHVCSRLARLTGLLVVSLEYRLAPEHPYPAALHDARDAMGWLARHGPLLGGDGRVMAGGQSAGAALVAGACLLARDEGEPYVTRQVLCYPVLDFDQDTESFREFDGVFHSIKPGQWSHAQYLAGQPVTPYAAPLRAARLAGLAPALVIGAGRDPLRDDARAYAARLDGDGVDVSYVEYTGTMHAFLNFCGVLAAGDHAIEMIAADLMRILGRHEAEPRTALRSGGTGTGATPDRLPPGAGW